MKSDKPQGGGVLQTSAVNWDYWVYSYYPAYSAYSVNRKKWTVNSEIDKPQGRGTEEVNSEKWILKSDKP